MTVIYFIRHAESDYSVRESRIRPLTEKGLADCSLVSDFLSERNIDVVLSSPYKRAVDTLDDFIQKNNLEIQIVEGFCEQRSDSGYLARTIDFSVYAKNHWEDFNYRLGNGESFFECQKRNIIALENTLSQYNGKNIAIGTHGIALSTIINYYDNTYGYDDFMTMAFIFPWVVKMSFDNNCCVSIEKIDLFHLNKSC
jgi:2,3-bisphosphoglycerate-dependent phosphoglycerate mutase